jgi:hypothetical protein
MKFKHTVSIEILTYTSKKDLSNKKDLDNKKLRVD